MKEMLKEVQYCEKIIKTKFKTPLKMSSEDEQNFNAAKECHFFINSRGFPVSVLHWDQKDRRYGLKSGSGTHLVNGETKDHIVAEASAHFKLEGQILVFQDGKEVPDNFNLRSYTLEKKIRFPSIAKAGDNSTYFMLVREKVYAPIFTNIIFWKTYNTLMIRWMM